MNITKLGKNIIKVATADKPWAATVLDELDNVDKFVEEFFTFILDNIKYTFPQITKVSLGPVEKVNNRKFKSRLLEVAFMPFETKGAKINGEKCSISSFKIEEEYKSEPIYEMCSSIPVCNVVKKKRNVGIIKNTSIKKEKLKGVFNIEINLLKLSGCTLIYALGEDFITEAKFLIGKIE